MVTTERNNTLKKIILGKQRKFYHVIIEIGQVEKHTRVFNLNERNQELLNKHCVEDILPSIRQSKRNMNEVYARKVGNDYEIADGSRRRFACIEGKAALIAWVCDDLTNEDMKFLSISGNKHKQPSIYERGLEYIRLLENGTYSSPTDMEEETGIKRRTLNRCINTAKLPTWLIKAYRSPNDIGAQTADLLHKVITKNTINDDILKRRAKECMKSWEQPTYSGDTITRKLTADVINPGEKEDNKDKGSWLIKNKVKLTPTSNGVRYDLPNLTKDQQTKLNDFVKKILTV